MDCKFLTNRSAPRSVCHVVQRSSAALAAIGASSLLALASPAHAQAQPSPLAGDWQGLSRLADGVKVPIQSSFSADGRFSQRMGIPPRSDGTGSGWVVAGGTYRMTSAHTVQFVYEGKQACLPDGTFCRPVPYSAAPVTFTISWSGPDQFRDSDGTIYSRLR
jgi:hypothetical protein